MIKNHRYAIIWSSIGLLIAGAVALLSQTAGNREALIKTRVEESRLVPLPGNTRPEATLANDLGAVSDGLAMDHMMLQLKRSPEQEKAVEQFVASLYDPSSSNFHQWVTAEQFGKNFGPAESDVRAVTGWLESHGFTVNSVYPGGMLIDFSGNAGQVRRAFHTTIHNLEVNGERHIANFGDAQIPATLAPVVHGIVSLHDFRPKKMIAPQYTFPASGQTIQAVTPQDLATIYDFNPLFAAGTTGKGQTVAVIENTDLYSRSDWVNFRSTFGLSTYTSASLVAQHPAAPSGINNCSLPGVNGDDIEAALDVEWATAAAPGATIVAAACADTSVTFGGLIAMQNLVNASNPPAVMSVSYGFCEASLGASLNSSLNSLFQQGAAEGMSIFVASGDGGAAGCDDSNFIATHGVAVSGFASTPYNVAVGGTDFSDTFSGTQSAYWNSTNTATYGSAKSYIPEIPWNSSCASALIATYNGYSTGYGASGFCNSAKAMSQGFVRVSGGGGGPSNCATGAPSMPLVASGTCAGYPKPSWQSGVAGIPSDGVRDTPDVSMFAADGAWRHIAVLCFSNSLDGGTPCVGAPSNWSLVGGTSLSTPVMAGIQALVNQAMGKAQGNPNPVYYSLAANVTGVFHPTTQGDIDVNCGGIVNCYGYVGTLDYGRGGRIFGTTWAGALSTSNTSFQPAFNAGSAWNFATGLGSVDVNNLVTNWTKGQ